jgi:hypothetical protein
MSDVAMRQRLPPFPFARVCICLESHSLTRGQLRSFFSIAIIIKLLLLFYDVSLSVASVAFSGRNSAEDPPLQKST